MPPLLSRPDDRAVDRLRAHRVGIACACLLVALFSAFVLVSRYGLTTDLTLPDIAALRFGISGLLLAPIVWRQGFCGLRPGQAARLAFLGGLGFALLAYSGFRLAPAAHGAVLLHGTLPLTTVLLTGWSGPDRRWIGTAWGTALIVAGIAVMVGDGLQQANPGVLLGDVCLVLASFCWSGYGLTVRRHGLAAPPASAIVAVLSAATFLPVYAVLPGGMLLQADWRDLALQAGFQGVLIGTVSIFVYTRTVALLGAFEVACFTAAVPGITALGGYLFLNESPGLAAVAGIGFVGLGMLATIRGPSATTPTRDQAAR